MQPVDRYTLRLLGANLPQSKLDIARLISAIDLSPDGDCLTFTLLSGEVVEVDVSEDEERFYFRISGWNEEFFIRKEQLLGKVH